MVKAEKTGLKRIDHVARGLQEIQRSENELLPAADVTDGVSFTFPEGWESPQIEVFPSCPTRLSIDVAGLKQATGREIVVEPVGENTFDFQIRPSLPNRNVILTRAHNIVASKSRAALSQSRKLLSGNIDAEGAKDAHEAETKTQDPPPYKAKITSSNPTAVVFPGSEKSDRDYTMADALTDYNMGTIRNPKKKTEDGQLPWKSKQKTNPNPKTKPKFVPRGTGRYSRK